jgi:hypothetical protein
LSRHLISILPIHAFIFLSHPDIFPLVRSARLPDLPATAALLHACTASSPSPLPPPWCPLRRHTHTILLLLRGQGSDGRGEEVVREAMARRRASVKTGAARFLRWMIYWLGEPSLLSHSPRPSSTWRRWIEDLRRFHDLSALLRS